MLKLNKIYNLDVNIFLKKYIKNESIDLVIADPPYNILNLEWDTFNNECAYFEFMESWLKLTYKKLKLGGSIYLFNNSYNSSKLVSILEKIGYKFRDWIIWYKKDGFSYSRNKYVNNQEVILFFTKGENYIFNANDIRVPYLSNDRIKHASRKGIIKNGVRWYPNPNGKLCTNVWEIPSQRHLNKINGKVTKPIHPTIKPHKLIERIILASSNVNDVVLDLFSGSGTTSIIAKKLKRTFIGCEKNETYFKYIIEQLDIIFDNPNA